MVSAFSFCLYGPENPRYYNGLLENLVIIQRHYPTWRVYIYIGNDVPAPFVERLRRAPQVILRETGVVGHKNSVYRFFAINEPNVDVVFFRDADSRVHWKDRWAINDFLQSGRGVHIIRDHPMHCTEILAGLWGLRKGVLPFSLQAEFESWTPIHAGSGDPNIPGEFGIDQNFLVKRIYSLVRERALVHHSNGRVLDEEDGREFPFAWADEIYCGRVESGYLLTGNDVEHRKTPLSQTLFHSLPKARVKLS